MELKRELAEEIIKNSKFFEEAVSFFEKKGFKKEVIEKALLETGDLKKAYDYLKKYL
jgi:predicted metal-binding transcription factor (methanogenesis marker protein 9)